MIENVIQELDFLSQLSPIQQEDTKVKLVALLNELPLDNLGHLVSIHTLIKILNHCQTLNLSRNILYPILARWCGDHIDVDGVIGDLAANMTCDMKILKYICSEFETSTPLTILETHIMTRYGTGMVFSLVADRVLQIFDQKNLDFLDWLHLIKTTEDLKNKAEYDPHFISRESYSVMRNNQDILEYIESKVKSLQKVLWAKKPTWVTLENDESEQTYLNQEYTYVDQTNTDDELTRINELMNKYLEKEKLDPSDLGDVAPLKAEEVAEIYVSLQNNNYDKNTKFPIERFLGPANAILRVNCPTSNLSDKESPIGPCRMFSCICREYDDENEEEYTNLNEETDPISVWFTGQCEVCYKSIQKARHAVRFPIDGGGWLGCFCSFECLRKTTLRPIYESDDFRIQQIQDILETLGVADI